MGKHFSRALGDGKVSGIFHVDSLEFENRLHGPRNVLRAGAVGKRRTGRLPGRETVRSGFRSGEVIITLKKLEIGRNWKCGMLSEESVIGERSYHVGHLISRKIDFRRFWETNNYTRPLPYHVLMFFTHCRNVAGMRSGFSKVKKSRKCPQSFHLNLIFSQFAVSDE